MGELHVIFYALKVLGKLIDGSGLGQAIVDAGLYYRIGICNLWYKLEYNQHV